MSRRSQAWAALSIAERSDLCDVLVRAERDDVGELHVPPDLLYVLAHTPVVSDRELGSGCARRGNTRFNRRES